MKLPTIGHGESERREASYEAQMDAKTFHACRVFEFGGVGVRTVGWLGPSFGHWLSTRANRGAETQELSVGKHSVHWRQGISFGEGRADGWAGAVEGMGRWKGSG